MSGVFVNRMRQWLSDKKNRLRRFMWQRLFYTGRESRPAFLVGCGRSGTSMLVLQLGKSWQLEVYNENNLAAFHNWRLRDFVVVQQLVNKSHAPITLFKPILDTYRARLILDTFPAGKMLFAFRHYSDVVESSLKKFGAQNRITHVNNWVTDNFSEFADLHPPAKTQALIGNLWQPGLGPESGAALYWLFQNQLYFDLGLNRHKRVKLIQYEAVVQDPAGQLANIAAFLDIGNDQRMTEGIFASSVQHRPVPNLAPAIAAACQKLWEELRVKSYEL